MVISKLKLRIWWYIFFGVQFLLVIFIIGSLASEKWVKTNFTSCTFEEDNGYSYSTFCGKFAGNLSKCKEGCDETYASESVSWCDFDNDSNYDSYDNAGDSLCLMFYGLYIGALILIIFEISTFISIIVWCSTMICTLYKCNCFWMTCCCSVCSCVSHFLGMIIWFAITKANFNNDCSTFPSDGSQPKLCATDGPGLGVFIMVIFPIIVAFYLYIGCDANSRYKEGTINVGPAVDGGNNFNGVVPTNHIIAEDINNENAVFIKTNAVNINPMPMVIPPPMTVANPPPMTVANPQPMTVVNPQHLDNSKSRKSQESVKVNDSSHNRSVGAHDNSHQGNTIPIYFNQDEIGKYTAFQLVPFHPK